ncbi:MAG: hypothetical protein JO255_04880, partial [Alphaproteobacteria bacterium]|nr:hypothetical protein [Alphaproteobacteria bacterium]
AHAVSGIDLGKALDTYHNGLSHNLKQNAANAKKLEGTLAKYLKGIKESQVEKGKFSNFKSEFTSHYVKMATDAAEEFTAMSGDLAAYTERLKLVLGDGLKLKAGVTLQELQAFRQGPIRGLLALGPKVRGFDPKDITQLWKPIDDVINKLGANNDQQTLDKVVHLIQVTVPKTKSQVAKDGITV